MEHENKNKRFSFIIPAYNSENSLHKCVESIENDVQRIDITCEILIIENGSTDKTWDRAQGLAEKYSNIKIFKSAKGVSKARNKGIEESCGEKIVFIDADDEWVAGSSERISQKMDEKISGKGLTHGRDDDTIA